MPKLLSPLGRGLAAAQLLKETLTIFLLGLPLLLEQPVLVPAVLPGLGLYVFRWVLVLGRVARRRAALLWGLTLIDELWGLGLYLRVNDTPTARELHYLTWSSALGLSLTAAALLEIAWRRGRERRRWRRRVPLAAGAGA